MCDAASRRIDGAVLLQVVIFQIRRRDVVERERRRVVLCCCLFHAVLLTLRPSVCEAEVHIRSVDRTSEVRRFEGEWAAMLAGFWPAGRATFTSSSSP